ncbi:MAG: porin [Pseudomonadales bacterium]|nr:porin [Pseudomonadales bacterium]
MNPIKFIAAASLCSLSFSSLAEPTVTTNAFITAGISFTDSKIDYAGVGRNPNSSDVSKVGLQFNFDPDIDLPIDFTFQLLSKGRTGWSVEAEWAYLSYTPTDTLKVTVGKILAPFFMLSQSIDVGITYPWALPPEDVYGSANIPFNSVAGFDITYSNYIGDLEYSATLYNGENEFNVPAAGLTVDVDMQRTTGVVFELRNDYGMLRYSIHDIEFTDNVAVATGGGFPNATDGKVLFTTYGGKFEWGNIMLMAEQAKRAMSNSAFPTTRSWYTTIGYRVEKYLPSLTYSEIETSNSPINQSESTLTAALEITTSPASRLNFEISRISPDTGSAGLFDTFPAALGGQPVDDTTKITSSFSLVF